MKTKVDVEWLQTAAHNIGSWKTVFAKDAPPATDDTGWAASAEVEHELTVGVKAAVTTVKQGLSTMSSSLHSSAIAYGATEGAVAELAGPKR